MGPSPDPSSPYPKWTLDFLPPGLMHLSRLPERPRGERDREEEDDRAPQALLLSDSESDERLRRLRRDLRSPLAPVGLLAVGNRVGGSWGAEAVTRGRCTLYVGILFPSTRTRPLVICRSPRSAARGSSPCRGLARPRSCNVSLGTGMESCRDAGILARKKNSISLNE